MAEIKFIPEEVVEEYSIRITNRQTTWGRATMALLEYLMSVDPEEDITLKYENAKALSIQLAEEITFEKIGFFWIGNVKPLKTAIGATELLDDVAKGLVLSILNLDE